MVLVLQATEAPQRAVLSHGLAWIDNARLLHCWIAQDLWLNTFFQ
jgi:hypothetical protein